jgi:undecaprenyl diphosphate synthase
MVFKKILSLLSGKKNEVHLDDELNEIPRHVAIIMDGNRRWAKHHLFPRYVGHLKGAKVAWNAIKFASLNKIEVLTLYSFSLENWNRPIKEVTSILKISEEMLDKKIAKINELNIKLIFIGDRSKLEEHLQKKMIEGELITEHNTGLKLIVAISYSGQWDLLQAINKLVKNNVPVPITSEQLEASLLTAGLPMVDLLIRTSGELRISNFFLWQIAYSELYFTDVLWPDFNELEFKKALYSYSKRERRFGTRL